MKINFKLSENENQILETMWREERPLVRSEIIELTVDKTWKESSIHILLNQLLDKKAIEIGEIVETGKSFGRTYKPTLTRDEYEEMQLTNSFKEINPSKNSIRNFFSALAESESIDDELLEELRDILKKDKED